MGPRAGLDVLENRKVSAPTDIRTSDRPTRSLDTTPNRLPRLPSECTEDIFRYVHTLCLLVSLFTDPVRYPMGRGLGGPQGGSGRFGEAKNFLPLPRF